MIKFHERRCQTIYINIEVTQRKRVKPKRKIRMFKVSYSNFSENTTYHAFKERSSVHRDRIDSCASDLWLKHFEPFASIYSI